MGSADDRERRRGGDGPSQRTRGLASGRARADECAQHTCRRVLEGGQRFDASWRIDIAKWAMVLIDNRFCRVSLDASVMAGWVMNGRPCTERSCADD